MINIILYSNCQGDAISFFLQNYLQRNVIPHKITHIVNYTVIKDKDELDYESLKNADIFLYQHLGSKHDIYSTDFSVVGNVLSYLKNDCIKISFPYIFNSAFWSMFPECGYIGTSYTFSENYDFIDNSDIITDYIKKGCGLDQLLYMFDNNQIDFKYKERYDHCMFVLKEKEKMCDVKISDFIDEHKTTHRMFLTQNHPTTYVFVDVTNQILKKLNINFQFSLFEEIPNLPPLFTNKWDYNRSDISYWNFKYPADSRGHDWTKSLIQQLFFRTI